MDKNCGIIFNPLPRSGGLKPLAVLSAGNRMFEEAVSSFFTGYKKYVKFSA
jgi:hypothetical protein